MRALFILSTLLNLLACERGKDLPQRLSGQELYLMNCKRCHGVEAKGSAIAKFSLASRLQTLPDSEFLSTVLYGKPRTLMKGFEGRLKKEEIEKIKSYLKKLIEDKK